MSQNSIFAPVLVALLAGSAPAFAGPPAGGPVINQEVAVAASPAQVWEAWTTEEGAKTFFAPDANIDATVGGHYELFFSPDQPYGFRGADGNKVHDIVAGKLLVFTWNAPPDFGVLRNLHTLVFVRLEELDGGHTRVILSHTGFGESPQWMKLRDYFSEAWGVVLSRLKHRFEHGPVDWSNPPQVGAADARTSEGGEATR